MEIGLPAGFFPRLHLHGWSLSGEPSFGSGAGCEHLVGSDGPGAWQINTDGLGLGIGGWPRFFLGNVS